MVNLLASLNTSDEIHLLIGYSNGTYNRIRSIIDSNAKPILITHNSSDAKHKPFPTNVQRLVDSKELIILNRPFNIQSDLFTLGRSQVNHVVDRVFVNLLQASTLSLKKQIFQVCQANRIPLNITTSPELSTFTILSTHTDGDFQFGVTTNGKGCKLANRVKRDIVSKLPRNIASICTHIGELRQRIQQEDQAMLESQYEEELDNYYGEDEDSVQSAEFNKFVNEYDQSASQRKEQRARWLNQVVEYYPLEALVKLRVEDLTSEYCKSSAHDTNEPVSSGNIEDSQTKENELPVKKSKANPSDQESQDKNTETVTTSTSSILTEPSTNQAGTISLVGSGPGSVAHLTLGALQEIQTADLILLDKLVPSQIQSLIPSSVEKFIARKFPGNAEAAQEELLALGLEALQQGKKVVRLKQGDPYIFGRGGEEVEFFQTKHGFKVNVFPGVTSALSAPLTAGIPCTQREVADQVLILTGTGRKGAMPDVPDFVKSRTMVFLMALHRVDKLADALFGKGYSGDIPCCIIERSSCPDQRVTRTNLSHLVECVQEIGSRPPGLLVLGYACEALVQSGLTEGKNWTVEEGYDVNEDTIDVVSLLKRLQN